MLEEIGTKESSGLKSLGYDTARIFSMSSDSLELVPSEKAWGRIQSHLDPLNMGEVTRLLQDAALG